MNITLFVKLSNDTKSNNHMLARWNVVNFQENTFILKYMEFLTLVPDCKSDRNCMCKENSNMSDCSSVDEQAVWSRTIINLVCFLRQSLFLDNKVYMFNIADHLNKNSILGIQH